MTDLGPMVTLETTRLVTDAPPITLATSRSTPQTTGSSAIPPTTTSDPAPGPCVSTEVCDHVTRYWKIDGRDDRFESLEAVQKEIQSGAIPLETDSLLKVAEYQETPAKTLLSESVRHVWTSAKFAVGGVAWGAACFGIAMTFAPPPPKLAIDLIAWGMTFGALAAVGGVIGLVFNGVPAGYRAVAMKDRVETLQTRAFGLWDGTGTAKVEVADGPLRGLVFDAQEAPGRKIVEVKRFGQGGTILGDAPGGGSCPGAAPSTMPISSPARWPRKAPICSAAV